MEPGERLGRDEPAGPQGPVSCPVLVSLSTAGLRPVFFPGGRLGALVFDLLVRQAKTEAVCLLPDHLAWLLADGEDLDGVVGRFKCFSASLATRLGFAGRLWQRRFWDRPLPSTAELRAARRWIRAAPARAGLAREPERYPFLLLRRC